MCRILILDQVGHLALFHVLAAHAESANLLKFIPRWPDTWLNLLFDAHASTEKGGDFCAFCFYDLFSEWLNLRVHWIIAGIQLVLLNDFVQLWLQSGLGCAPIGIILLWCWIPCLSSIFHFVPHLKQVQLLNRSWRLNFLHFHLLCRTLRLYLELAIGRMEGLVLIASRERQLQFLNFPFFARSVAQKGALFDFTETRYRLLCWQTNPSSIARHFLASYLGRHHCRIINRHLFGAALITLSLIHQAPCILTHLVQLRHECSDLGPGCALGRWYRHFRTIVYFPRGPYRLETCIGYLLSAWGRNFGKSGDIARSFSSARLSRQRYIHSVEIDFQFRF